MIVVLYVRKGPLQSVHVLRHLTVKVKSTFGGLGERVFTGPKIVILKNHLTLNKRGINATITIEHWVRRATSHAIESESAKFAPPPLCVFLFGGGECLPIDTF